MNIEFAEQIGSKTDDELVEIYTNYSNYQPEFIEFARQEIIKRNIPLSALDNIKNKNEAINARILELGKQGNPIYLAIIGISAIFGGVIGIIGGYIYAYATHTDANGTKYFVYNKSTRKWGEIIFFIGIIIFLITLYLEMT